MAEVTALLLAGGRSRRFGSDKSLAVFQGAPMARQVVDAAARVFERVLVVSRHHGRHAFLGVPVLRDLLDTPHPLGGVLSAFQQDHADAYCVLPCDAPLMRPELLELLRDGAPGHEAAFCRWGGLLQPLPCLLRRGAAAKLAPGADGALPALRSLAGLLDARVFSEDEVRRRDPLGLSFLDVDSPADMAGLEAHAR